MPGPLPFSEAQILDFRMIFGTMGPQKACYTAKMQVQTTIRGNNIGDIPHCRVVGGLQFSDAMHLTRQSHIGQFTLKNLYFAQQFIITADGIFTLCAIQDFFLCGSNIRFVMPGFPVIHTEYHRAIHKAVFQEIDKRCCDHSGAACGAAHGKVGGKTNVQLAVSTQIRMHLVILREAHGCQCRPVDILPTAGVPDALALFFC